MRKIDSVQNEDEEETVTISTDDVEVRILKSKLTPEIMTKIGELIEKTKVSQKLKQEPLIAEKLEPIEPVTLNERDITDEELKEYAKRVPSLKRTMDYIIQRPEFRHSFRDMQMEFLGMVFSQDDNLPNQQKIYRAFYSRLYRAHDKIRKQYNGIWRDETIAPIDEPKFKAWWFEKNEQLQSSLAL